MTTRREELAWAAGFFDGEGSTTVSNGNRIRVVIGQVDKEVLERFKQAVGAGSINGPYIKNGHLARRPIYRYQLTGWRAVQAVIAKLWPFLGTIKREQARQRLTTCHRERHTVARVCKRDHPYEGNRTAHNQCRLCMQAADKRRIRTRSR